MEIGKNLVGQQVRGWKRDNGHKCKAFTKSIPGSLFMT